MSSIYVKNLINTVIEKSVNKSWNTAVLEWEIDDVIEDENHESSCICGKENIRYLFTIKNINNQNTLFPIGSLNYFMLLKQMHLSHWILNTSQENY